MPATCGVTRFEPVNSVCRYRRGKRRHDEPLCDHGNFAPDESGGLGKGLEVTHKDVVVGPRRSKLVRRVLIAEVVWATLPINWRTRTSFQDEMERPLGASRHVGPTERRVDTLQRALEHPKGSAERLVTPDQEELLSLDDLPSHARALQA
jgi:hypothetical protein